MTPRNGIGEKFPDSERAIAPISAHHSMAGLQSIAALDGFRPTAYRQVSPRADVLAGLSSSESVDPSTFRRRERTMMRPAPPTLNYGRQMFRTQLGAQVEECSANLAYGYEGSWLLIELI